MKTQFPSHTLQFWKNSVFNPPRMPKETGCRAAVHVDRLNHVMLISWRRWSERRRTRNILRQPLVFVRLFTCQGKTRKVREKAFSTNMSLLQIVYFMRWDSLEILRFLITPLIIYNYYKTTLTKLKNLC